ERFWPGAKQDGGQCAGKKLVSFSGCELPFEHDHAILDCGRHDLCEEALLVVLVDLGCHAERQLPRTRELCGPFSALLGRYAADEGQVLAGLIGEWRILERQPVMHGCDPI